MPIFFSRKQAVAVGSKASWQEEDRYLEGMLPHDVIERTVQGCGYDLVDVERAPGGVLRVYIDLLPGALSAGGGITIADCEKVSNQLSYVLTVDGVDYARLEVSSPGLDRPLKKWSDFVRFAGEKASVRLRVPVEGMGNQRVFQGTLQEPEGDELILEWEAKENTVVLRFSPEDVEKARLVPQTSFKGLKK